MPPKVKFALVPYHLQQEIIDYMDGKKLNAIGKPYRFFVVAIGRQAGKSWLAKYTLLEHAINRGEECMWVAPSIPTARGHWDDLVKMIENSGIPVRRLSQSAKQIDFIGGGRISVRSVIEPDNLRGATLDYLVLDEAAFFREGEYAWYSVLLPMVTASGGTVLFTSTPNGRNWFHRIFKSGVEADNKYYKSFHAPSTISPYQDPDLLEELRKTMPPYQWQEEFLAEFLSDSGGVFSGVDRASKVTFLTAPLENHTYVAGIDFGGNHDSTAFTVIDKYTRQQVYGKRFYSSGTIETIRELVDLLHLWQPEITHLEKNGIGDSMFDILKKVVSGRMNLDGLTLSVDDVTPPTDFEYEPTEDFDDSVEARYNAQYASKDVRTTWGGRLVAIHMDNSVKRKLVERLAAAIEYGRLDILVPTGGTYGEIQVDEMSTYMRERTQSGLDVTYNAADEAHDDTISALYLAFKGVPEVREYKKAIPESEFKNPFRTGGRHLKRVHNNA